MDGRVTGRSIAHAAVMVSLFSYFLGLVADVGMLARFQSYRRSAVD